MGRLLVCIVAVVVACGSADAGSRLVPGVGIDWADCGDIECTTVLVPEDHTDQASGTVAVAVGIHRSRSEAVGVLFVNPGGPGGSGVSYARALARTQPRLVDRFDIIGIDPRGVAGSGDIDCDEPLLAFYHLDSSPDTPDEQLALDTGAAVAARACADARGASAAFGTRVAAADMDAVRAALGVDAVTYLGSSYGSTLGLTYAAMYPERLRAMVIDGVTDPTMDLETWLVAQASAHDAALRRTLAACDECIPSGDAAFARALAVIESAETDGTRQPNSGDLHRAALVANSGADQRAEFHGALIAAAGGEPDALVSLGDQYFAGARLDSYTATACVDRPHPEGARDYRDLAQRATAAAPLLGSAVANELLPCATWSAPAETPISEADLTALGQMAAAAPILVLGNLADAATPYVDSASLVERLAQATLLTYDGSGHTSFDEGSPCVDDAVIAFLTSATPAPPDQRC